MKTDRRQVKNLHSYVPTGETYGPVNSPIYMKNGKTYIKVTSGKDNRYLILPDSEINIQTTDMMQEEWERLLEKTKRPTMQQCKLFADEYLKKKAIKQEESEKRKKEMQLAMETAKKTRQLNPLEKERESQRKYTLDRAEQLLLDQQEPVKEFNRMVALKKCIATWDQQILEKIKIKSNEKKEKLRQEREDEQIRRQNVKQEEIDRQKENADRQTFIRALGEQIKEREIALKLQMERKQLERSKFNEAEMQAQIDELEFFKQKAKNDEKVREEQRRVNVLIQRLQAIDREEDRIFFEKAQSTAHEIQKEIEGKETEKREIEKKRKEELQKMADEKVKAEDMAKFKDLMEEVLRQDNVERSWRHRELMEKQEKQRGLDEMYEQLQKQVKGRRIAKAQVIEEERRQVCKVAKDNIEDLVKEQEAERKVKLANETQRMEILLQLNEIDRRKLLDKENRKMESNFYQIQEERRVERAKNGMWQRVDQIRKDGLPEKYVNDLEQFVKEKYGPRVHPKR